MAPKSARGTTNTNVTTLDTAQIDNTEKFTWSGRPLDKPSWFHGNRKSLYDDIPGAERFCEQGVVRTEGCCIGCIVYHAV